VELIQLCCVLVGVAVSFATGFVLRDRDSLAIAAAALKKLAVQLGF
jgi:hypothetical protein